MSTILYMWPIWVLLIIGCAIFAFNMRQAVTGARQMRKLNRDMQEEKARMSEFDAVAERLDQLKAQFDEQAAHLSKEERLALWKPVDEALVRAVDAALYLSVGGSNAAATEVMKEAVAEAEKALERLNNKPVA